GLKAQKSSTGASATPHFEPISGNTPTATCRLSRSRRGSSAVTRACWVTCHLLGPSPRLRGSVLHNSASASSPSGGTQFMLPLVSSTNKKFAGIKLASTATAAHWLNRGAASVCHQFAPPSSGLELGSSPLEVSSLVSSDGLSTGDAAQELSSHGSATSARIARRSAETSKRRIGNSFTGRTESEEHRTTINAPSYLVEARVDESRPQARPAQRIREVRGVAQRTGTRCTLPGYVDLDLIDGLAER